MSSPEPPGRNWPELLLGLNFGIVYEARTEGPSRSAQATFGSAQFSIVDTAEGSARKKHPPYEMWCSTRPAHAFLPPKADASVGI